MHAEQLLSRLQGVKGRGASRWVAKCPAHKDRSPSLSIAQLPDGRLLLNDFGGCSVQAILDALGLELKDLFPAPLGHHLAPIERAGSHAHAAADALKVIAREALVVVLAAEDQAAGLILKPKERERLLIAAGVIASAARIV
jgi:hypothetical protein